MTESRYDMDRKLEDYADSFWSLNQNSIRDIVKDIYRRGFEAGIEATSKAYAESKPHWIVTDDTERFMAYCSNCGYHTDSRMLTAACPECRSKMGTTAYL